MKNQKTVKVVTNQKTGTKTFYIPSGVSNREARTIIKKMRKDKD